MIKQIVSQEWTDLHDATCRADETCPLPPEDIQAIIDAGRHIYETDAKLGKLRDALDEEKRLHTMDINLLTEKHVEYTKLKGLLRSTHRDLLMRGERDSGGQIVVNIGATVWSRIKEAIK